ncbi:MAG: GreA/GreB family elongation factor, partial [Candidatus Omnitrophica bacterium]|nr:GreA/GreB family elongation factor [Candidatus Omnitrophota bacterium]
GAAYHSSKSARDRDRTRQEVLEGLGWEIYRIWSTDWFHNPDKEFDKLKLHIEQTIKRKVGEREQREQTRLSNVVELQQKVQEDLFTAREEESQEIVQDTISSKEPVQSQTSNDNIIELFDTVSFQYIDEQEQGVRTVTIVSSQSDVSIGNINQHSAIGRALIGSELDEEIEINLPNGSKVLLITEIKKYASLS